VRYVTEQMQAGRVALRIPEERADGFRSASKVTISDAEDGKRLLTEWRQGGSDARRARHRVVRVTETNEIRLPRFRLFPLLVFPLGRSLPRQKEKAKQFGRFLLLS
jgi:hypothetical protein